MTTTPINSIEKRAAELGLQVNTVDVTAENKHKFYALYASVPDHSDALAGLKETVIITAAASGFVSFLLGAMMGLPVLITHAWVVEYILGAAEGTFLLATAGTFFVKKSVAKVEDQIANKVYEAAAADTSKALRSWLLQQYGVVPAAQQLMPENMDSIMNGAYSSRGSEVARFKSTNGKTYALYREGYPPSLSLCIVKVRIKKQHNQAPDEREEYLEYMSPLLSNLVNSLLGSGRKAKASYIDEEQPFNRKNSRAYYEVMNQLATLDELTLSTESEYIVERSRTDLANVKKLRDDKIKLNPKAADPRQVAPILRTINRELQRVLAEEEKMVDSRFAVEESYVLSRESTF